MWRKTFLLLSRDAGERLDGDTPFDKIERLGRHFRRFPAARQLLTYLVVLLAKANASCTCPACAKEYERSRRTCTKGDVDKMLAEMLPGFYAPKVAEAKPVHVPIVFERIRANRGG